jgi:hypothetical protein
MQMFEKQGSQESRAKQSKAKLKQNSHTCFQIIAISAFVSRGHRVVVTSPLITSCVGHVVRKCNDKVLGGGW